MDIVLVGSGNVATHLGGALVGAGHRVKQVYSRTAAHAVALADTLDAEAITDLAAIDTHADIYILAVKDDAIAAVAEQLPGTLQGVVVHTAGSVDIAVFDGYVAVHGVFYPLQTFSKAKLVDFATIPIAVEASDDTTLAVLETLAASISNRTFRCDSKQRLSLHVAAVFACNFTNHFYAIAARILEENRLDFDLIRPLILETAEKAMEHQPADVQTGPAVRHDVRTMAKHRELLKADPALSSLYELVSGRIGKG